ncbi:hypothetical protein KKE60_04715 [Patescibacteria group bacterium]|nr:hypothetical protein [Patescibacteria group bacterium]
MEKHVCNEVRWEINGEKLVIKCVKDDVVETITDKATIIFQNRLWGCNIKTDGGSCTDGLAGKVKLEFGTIFGVENAIGVYPLPFKEGGRPT